MTIKNRSRVCLMVSAGIMVIALVMSLFGYGINFGIDFAGGLNIQYDMKQTFDQADVENALKSQGITDFMVSTSGENKQHLQVRIPQQESDEDIQTIRKALEDELAAKYPDMDVNNATVGYVGPIAGATLIKNAILSVVIASALMLCYIALRFDLSSGIAAVFGLLHDVLIMISFMVLLRSVIQMNSSFIAAMLTIVGYSINNTIVIFDRIRENNGKTALARTAPDEIVNISIRESLGRTINTTLTTLVTIVALYVLGVDAIREFSLPIIIGILSGVYSANMINGYVWAYLQGRLRVGKNAKAKRA